MKRTIEIVHTVAPGNSQVVVPIDSTYRTIGGSGGASIATNSAYLVPGPYRAQWAGAVIRWSCLCTTQNVTVLHQILTGSSGVAADWETQGAAGSNTITAGTTSPGEFKPLTADWRIKIDAGATGPATLTFRLTAVLDSEDAGA